MDRKVAIVILNYNTYDETCECVKSIDLFCKMEYHIYIVDNCSQDDSIIQLKKQFGNDKRIDFIVSQKNLGFSGGNNLGIRKALSDGCEYIFLLNSDIILLNDALSIMCEKFQENEKIAVVGPKVYSNNKVFKFARKGMTFKSYMLDRNFVHKLFPKTINKLRGFEYDENTDFIFQGMVSGCCFGLRNEFILKNNCLDEKIFLYYEEDILAHVIERESNLAAICHAAEVIHNCGSATKRSSVDSVCFTRLYRLTSAIYVLKKYAKESKINVWLAKKINELLWFGMALLKKNYRDNLILFRREMKRMYEE